MVLPRAREQPDQGACPQVLDAVEAAAHALRHVREAQLFQVAEDDHFPVVLRQGRPAPRPAGRPARGGRPSDWANCPRPAGPGRGLARTGPARRPAGARGGRPGPGCPGSGAAAGPGSSPGPAAASSSVLFPSSPENSGNAGAPEERLLDQVVGIHLGREPPADLHAGQQVQVTPIALEEFSPGIPISAAGPAQHLLGIRPLKFIPEKLLQAISSREVLVPAGKGPRTGRVAFHKYFFWGTAAPFRCSNPRALSRLGRQGSTTNPATNPQRQRGCLTNPKRERGATTSPKRERGAISQARKRERGSSRQARSASEGPADKPEARARVHRRLPASRLTAGVEDHSVRA